MIQLFVFEADRRFGSDGHGCCLLKEAKDTIERIEDYYLGMPTETMQECGPLLTLGSLRNSDSV